MIVCVCVCVCILSSLSLSLSLSLTLSLSFEAQSDAYFPYTMFTTKYHTLICQKGVSAAVAHGLGIGRANPPGQQVATSAFNGARVGIQRTLYEIFVMLLFWQESLVEEIGRLSDRALRSEAGNRLQVARLPAVDCVLARAGLAYRRFAAFAVKPGFGQGAVAVVALVIVIIIIIVDYVAVVNDDEAVIVIVIAVVCFGEGSGGGIVVVIAAAAAAVVLCSVADLLKTNTAIQLRRFCRRSVSGLLFAFAASHQSVVCHTVRGEKKI